MVAELCAFDEFGLTSLLCTRALRLQHGKISEKHAKKHTRFGVWALW
jgi:hypothetical protein